MSDLQDTLRDTRHQLNKALKQIKELKNPNLESKGKEDLELDKQENSSGIKRSFNNKILDVGQIELQNRGIKETP